MQQKSQIPGTDDKTTIQALIKGLTPGPTASHLTRKEPQSIGELFDELEQYIKSDEELSFLFGYYAHLITDAELQRTIRDPQRVAAAWKRAKEYPEIASASEGMEETWDNFKKFFPSRKERSKDYFVIEREYLDSHPESGYFTEIKDLEEFPDYIDYLPKGAIGAKVNIMYYMPTLEEGQYPFVAFSRDEYMSFLDRAVMLAIDSIEDAKNIIDRQR